MRRLACLLYFHDFGEWYTERTTFGSRREYADFIIERVGRPYRYLAVDPHGAAEIEFRDCTVCGCREYR